MEENKQRPRGSGRIFKYRNSRNWHCAYFVNGKETRESCYTEDPKQAEKHLRACLKRVHVHEAHPEERFLTSADRRKTVSDLMDSLQTNFQLRGKASLQNLSGIRRVKKDFGCYRALSLTAAQIADYIRDRRAEGYQPATCNRWTETLRTGFALAELPCPKIIKLSEAGNVRSGFFSETEIRKLFSALPADLADFVLFGWLTGWRKGAISSLKWTDVTGNALVLRAEHAKNRTPQRLPLEGELTEVLERRTQRRALQRKDGTVRLSEYIFHRGDGKPVKEFRKSWRTACKLAGCPSRIFHDLRRSAVRNMVAAGTPESVAMRISGHKTRAMFDRYAIASENDVRKALATTQSYLKDAALREKTATLVPVTIQ